MVVFEVFDEFEIADADGGAGAAALVAVVGVMPEERALREGLTFEERRDADAVEVLPGARGEAGDVEEGGVDVGADRG